MNSRFSELSKVNLCIFQYLTILFLLSLSPNSLLAQYGGGSGTEQDPYVINTAAHLNNIGVNPLDWDKHFILMSDIDLSGYDGQDGNPIFNRIGESSIHPFKGTFDGNGFIISHFQYTGELRNFLGLFGSIDYPALLRDIHLRNVLVDSTSTASQYVGGLVGYNYRGVVKNCTVSGSVNGSTSVGGIIGDQRSAKLIRCSFDGVVTGSSNVGGLIGVESNSRIECCRSTGTVSASNYFGGAIGQSWHGHILNSSSSSLTERINVSFGAYYPAGGFVGAKHGGSIANCYAAGNVNSINRVGGFIGRASTAVTIDNCYSTGFVTSDTPSSTGGFVGSIDEGEIVACFYNSETSGQIVGVGENINGSVNILAETTANMKIAATYINQGWDFSTVWTNNDGVTYPSHLSLPDLVIQNEIEDFLIQAGEPTEFTFDIYNAGKVNVDHVDGILVSLYQSNTNIADWDTLEPNYIIDQKEFTSLDFDRILPETFLVTTSEFSGETYYRIKVDGDDVIEESHEDNNWSDVITITTFIHDQYEPDDSYLDAAEIDIDGTVQLHSFDPVGDEDWVKFTLNEKSSIVIELIDDDSQFNLYMRLYASDAETVLKNGVFASGYNQAHIKAVLEAGTYYVKTNENGHDQTVDEYGIYVKATPYMPDLQIKHSTRGYNGATPGQTVNLQLRVTNFAIASATEFSTQVFLADSPDADWDSLEPNAMIGQYDNSALPGTGELYQNNFESFVIPITAPLEDGIYYYRAKTDVFDEVEELDENNNWTNVGVLRIGVSYSFGGGSGTPEDPYQIWTPLQLNMIEPTFSLSRHFIQMADLDLSEYDGSKFNKIPKYSTHSSFTGSYNGNGYVIDNFNWGESGENIGIFSSLYNAEIKNVTLTNVDVHGFRYVGSLVGKATNSVIQNCSVDGVVRSGDAFNDFYINAYTVGGLVGRSSNSQINYCHANVLVEGQEEVGGLVGVCSNTQINLCKVEGQLFGISKLGGLVGVNSNNSQIVDCIANVDVTETSSINEISGGFAGGNISGSQISNCFSTGNVYAQSAQTGGFCGYNDSLISNSYTMSMVDGVDHVGGFVGNNDVNGSITYCYNANLITATGTDVGGFVGRNSGNITQCFWDMDLTVQTDTAGNIISGTITGSGLNTGFLQTQSTFSDVGWDFTNIWTIAEGLDYPRHIEESDLVVLDLLDREVLPSEQFTLHIPIANNGNGLAESNPGFITKVYRSTDSLVDWDSLNDSEVVAEFSLSELACGALHVQQVDIIGAAIPGSVTYYRIKTDASDDVFEENETNNWGNIITVETGGPDLVAYIDHQDFLKVGDEYTLNVTLTNNGIIESPGFTAKLFVSQVLDVDWDALDGSALVSSISVGPLAPGESYTQAINLTAPLTPGNLFYRALADSNEDVFEKDETNNWSFVRRVSFGASDLVISHSGDSFYATTESTITLDFRLINNKRIDASETFIVDLYLADQVVTDWNSLDPNTIIDSFEVTGLEGYGTLFETYTINLPAEPGVYYFRAEIDSINNVIEEDETNNWSEVISIAVNYNYGGGSGDPNDPYQIWNSDQMYNLSQIRTDWDKSFILMEHIDLALFDGLEDRPAMQPIGGGDTEQSFTGMFEGNHKTISNLTMIYEDYGDRVALFGFINNNAEIKNLGLKDVYIYVPDGYVVGGLVAWCGQGGQSAMISNCYVTGTILGDDFVGGLVARVNRFSTVYRCYADVNIIIPEDTYKENIGCFTGWCNGVISESFSRGSITGSPAYVVGVGGFVGGMTGPWGQIDNCYSKAIIDLNYSTGYFQGIGGFVGKGGYDDERSQLINCYSTGAVSVQGEDLLSVGGFSGSELDATNCFWDLESSELTESANGEAKTTGQMQMKDTFVDAGWLFKQGRVPSEGQAWEICDTESYPKLVWQKAINGDFGCPDGIDLLDLIFFADGWLSTRPKYDLNNDGIANIVDFSILSSNWMNN